MSRRSNLINLPTWSLILITICLVPALEGLQCFMCYYHGGYPEGDRNNTKSCLNPGPEFLETISDEPEGGSGGITFYPYCQIEKSVLDGFRFVQRTNSSVDSSWFATNDQNGICLKDLPGRKGSICYCNEDGCNGRTVKDISPKKKNDKSNEQKTEL